VGNLFSRIPWFFSFQDGWNPVNEIETVIVSIRSLLVMGGGRLEAASSLPKERYDELLHAASQETNPSGKSDGAAKLSAADLALEQKKLLDGSGSYSESEAKDGFRMLVDIHEKKGWSDWLKKNG
jgi:ubiquitin-conjugating enzyme E2 Q